MNSSSTDLLIRRSKDFIDQKDATGCRTFLSTTFGAREELEEDVDWVYVFQKVYLHACLRGLSDLATWMETEAFGALDPIQQIGVRQVFGYGHTLLRRRK